MGHPDFPTEPGPHWGKQWVLQTDWLSPSPAAVPTAGAASVKLAPLDLMTDHFFWQAPWDLAISTQEAGHSGLETDLHSVRNRTPLYSQWLLF